MMLEVFFVLRLTSGELSDVEDIGRHRVMPVPPRVGDILDMSEQRTGPEWTRKSALIGVVRSVQWKDERRVVVVYE